MIPGSARREYPELVADTHPGQGFGNVHMAILPHVTDQTGTTSLSLKSSLTRRDEWFPSTSSVGMPMCGMSRSVALRDLSPLTSDPWSQRCERSSVPWH